MRKILDPLWIPALAAFALLAAAPGPGVAADAEWRSRVDPWVLETTEQGAESDFLVVLGAQADLSGAARLATREEKGRFVHERLSRLAEATQGPLRARLRELGVEHRSYWVVNMIWARGGRDLVRELAGRADVARLAANPRVKLDAPLIEPHGVPEAIAWGVQQIGAPTYWAQGFTGQGVVVGGQDTGYDWDHEALIGKYRGWNGVTADHDYNWHDAIHSGGGICGPDSPEPCDDFGHGTHTMGTMVGDNGAGEQIGVAPGAKWIGCRNMDVGSGTPLTYSECFQWFIAPTDLNNQNPDPSKAPHVINNSWSCPPSEGCNDPDILLAVVENTRAAGILVAVSAANSGPSCETVDTPAAIYDASFTVGATDSSDAIASFSSRGAVAVDGSFRLKPDISAPGVSVCSSVPNDGYSCGFSGTSMAAPHVAGQVALLISADPALEGDVGALETCITATAVPRTTTQDCSGVPGSQVPNNTYGWGRVQLVWPPPPVCRSRGIFSDGFESGDTSAWSVAFP